MWGGKKLYMEALAQKIEAEGKAGWDALCALLPKRYEPPVVALVEEEAV